MKKQKCIVYGDPKEERWIFPKLLLLFTYFFYERSHNETNWYSESKFIIITWRFLFSEFGKKNNRTVGIIAYVMAASHDGSWFDHFPLAFCLMTIHDVWCKRDKLRSATRPRNHFIQTTIRWTTLLIGHFFFVVNYLPFITLTFISDEYGQSQVHHYKINIHTYIYKYTKSWHDHQRVRGDDVRRK